MVARGFQQRHGIDFEETFSIVVRWATVRIVIAIAIHNNWKIHQMDVQTAFLNGYLTVAVYLKQPEGFVQPGREHQVCKLHRFIAPFTGFSKVLGMVLPG